MPDLNHSHNVHRNNLKQIWKSKEWESAKEEFKKFHPDNKCERCGRIGNIVPGHCSEDYLDISSYIPKVRQNHVEALCPTCNFQERKGRKPCPICVKVKANKIYYIGDNAEYCFNHRPAEEVLRSEERKEVFKMLIERGKKIQNAKKRKIYQEMKLNGKH